MSEFHIMQFRTLGLLMNGELERICVEEIAMQSRNMQELTEKERSLDQY
jgi:hypothetical protein